MYQYGLLYAFAKYMRLENCIYVFNNSSTRSTYYLYDNLYLLTTGLLLYVSQVSSDSNETDNIIDNDEVPPMLVFMKRKSGMIARVLQTKTGLDQYKVTLLSKTTTGRMNRLNLY